MAFSCFVTGTAVFLRFFFLLPQLIKERVERPRTFVEQWAPWFRGRFSVRGARLQRQMNRLIVLGWVLLIGGLVLSAT